MANGNDSVRTLYVRESDLYREATPEETLLAADLAIARRFRRGVTLSSPQLVREYLRIRFARLDHEVFCVVLLDTHHRLLSFQEMFRGAIDGAAVFPREVVKEVLKHNAAEVILAQPSLMLIFRFHHRPGLCAKYGHRSPSTMAAGRR